MKKFLKNYKLHILFILLAIMIMPFAIVTSYEKRGQFTIGGEWFLPLLGYLFAVIVYDVQKLNRVWKYGRKIKKAHSGNYAQNKVHLK